MLREGSFDAAARALHLTPSALSQRIKALEQRVGGVLVSRERPCRVTPLGEPLLRHAQQVALLEAELARYWQAGARAAPAAATPLAVAVNADSLGTWFLGAVNTLAAEGGWLLELQVDDEGHTRERLLRGEVLAAVSARASPVQGCRVTSLGVLRYRVTASPAFAARWFPRGLRAEALARAPCLRFDAKDELQLRWLRRHAPAAIEPPAHRLPSSQAFVQACEAGWGWALNPEPLVGEALRAGRLLDLDPRHPLDVPLYWHCSRLPVEGLERLSQAVRVAAAQSLLQPSGTTRGSP